MKYTLFGTSIYMQSNVLLFPTELANPLESEMATRLVSPSSLLVQG